VIQIKSGLRQRYRRKSSVPSKGKNAQKIAKLKKELSNAKGQKRVKLIKQIAEMENSDLEFKLQSFR